jgi:hypothetical protein
VLAKSLDASDVLFSGVAYDTFTLTRIDRLQDNLLLLIYWLLLGLLIVLTGRWGIEPAPERNQLAALKLVLWEFLAVLGSVALVFVNPQEKVNGLWLVWRSRVFMHLRFGSMVVGYLGVWWNWTISEVTLANRLIREWKFSGRYDLTDLVPSISNFSCHAVRLAFSREILCELVSQFPQRNLACISLEGAIGEGGTSRSSVRRFQISFPSWPIDGRDLSLYGW